MPTILVRSRVAYRLASEYNDLIIFLQDAVCLIITLDALMLMASALTPTTFLSYRQHVVNTIASQHMINILGSVTTNFRGSLK